MQRCHVRGLYPDLEGFVAVHSARVDEVEGRVAAEFLSLSQNKIPVLEHLDARGCKSLLKNNISTCNATIVFIGDSRSIPSRTFFIASSSFGGYATHNY